MDTDLKRFHLHPGTDPTGNSMVTSSLVYIGTDGTVYRTGYNLCIHNSDGPVIVIGPADANPAYNLVQDAQTVTLPQGSLQVLIQS